MELTIQFNGHHKNNNFTIIDKSWKCQLTTKQNHIWTYTGNTTWVAIESNRNKNNWTIEYDRPYSSLTPEMIAFMQKIEQFVGPFLNNEVSNNFISYS